MRVAAAIAVAFVAAVAAVVEAEGREVEGREVEGRAVEGREGVELVAREERAIAATGVFLEIDALILLLLCALLPLPFDGKAKAAACTPPAF